LSPFLAHDSTHCFLGIPHARQLQLDPLVPDLDDEQAQQVALPVLAEVSLSL
jgi:hypothetical protein